MQKEKIIKISPDAAANLTANFLWQKFHANAISKFALAAKLMQKFGFKRSTDAIAPIKLIANKIINLPFAHKWNNHLIIKLSNNKLILLSKKYIKIKNISNQINSAKLLLTQIKKESI